MIATILIIVGTALIGLTGLWVVRWVTTYESRTDAAAISGLATGVIGSINGIVIAFLISTVWSDYQIAARLVESEAIGALTMHRLATALPKELAAPLAADIEAYVRSVLQDEWPAMMHGHESERTRAIFERVWAHTLSLQPVTATDQAIVTALNQELRQLHHARRQRLFSSRDEVPGLLWWLMIAGACMTLLGTFLVPVRDGRMHAFITVLLAASFALALITLYDLKQPFGGHVSIDGSRFEEALQVMGSRK